MLRVLRVVWLVWLVWLVLCDGVWCCARVSIRVRSQLEGVMVLEKMSAAAQDDKSPDRRRFTSSFQS